MLIPTNLRLNRIGVDLSPLWTNAEDQFTLRFKDISNEKQTKLSERIKITAQFHRITNQAHGPSIQEIKEALHLFNPIIFAESSYRNSIHNTYRNFAIYSAYTMTSYIFKKVCTSIYYILCLKRKLKRKEIEKIISTTIQNWTTISDFITTNFSFTENGQMNTNEERIREIPEIGLEDLAHIRDTLGAQNVPLNMNRLSNGFLNDQSSQAINYDETIQTLSTNGNITDEEIDELLINQ